MHMYTHEIGVADLGFHERVQRSADINRQMRDYFGRSESRRPNDRPGTYQWVVSLDDRKDRILVRVRYPKMLTLAALIVV